MADLIRKESIPSIGDRVVSLERHSAAIYIEFDSGKRVICAVSEFLDEVRNYHNKGIPYSAETQKKLCVRKKGKEETPSQTDN